MKDESSRFALRKANINKLVSFGFEKQVSGFEYKTALPSSGFEMNAIVSDFGEVLTEVIDPSTGDEYILHLGKAPGAFAGQVKDEYDHVLDQILAACFEMDVFKSDQAKELIAFVKEEYGDELEYLWKKFPDNAVLRRKDNGKWYAALLTVSKKKLGLPGDEKAEILDLRHDPVTLPDLIDGKKYFPGWHMNKKNWYTIILDGSVSIDEIKERIRNSYALAKK